MDILNRILGKKPGADERTDDGVFFGLPGSANNDLNRSPKPRAPVAIVIIRGGTTPPETKSRLSANVTAKENP